MKGGCGTYRPATQNRRWQVAFISPIDDLTIAGDQLLQSTFFRASAEFVLLLWGRGLQDHKELAGLEEQAREQAHLKCW